MRVAVVVERFEARGGGVEQAACELVRELAGRGVDVTVVCRSAGSSPPEGVRLHRLRVPRVWQPLRVAVFSASAAAGTREGFDVVHAYARTRHQDLFRAGGGVHRAYLESVHRRPGFRALLPRHRALLAIEEAVFRDPRQIVECLSQRDARELAQRYGVPTERLAVVPNGVDATRFDPARRAALREPTRRALGVAGPVALFVGSGFERKGLDRALRGLAKSGVAAQLLVAGADPPGRFRTLAARLGVAERVRFLGRRSDVEALHAAADLFVLPTRYDAFANSLLEAMASGLPVAVAPGAGNAELVEPGKSGWVLEEDFAPAFAGLADPMLLAALGREARRTAEGLSWARHADRVLELYERVIAARDRAGAG